MAPRLGPRRRGGDCVWPRSTAGCVCQLCVQYGDRSVCCFWFGSGRARSPRGRLTRDCPSIRTIRCWLLQVCVFACCLGGDPPGCCRSVCLPAVWAGICPRCSRGRCPGSLLRGFRPRVVSSRPQRVWGSGIDCEPRFGAAELASMAGSRRYHRRGRVAGEEDGLGDSPVRRGEEQGPQQPTRSSENWCD